MAKAYIKLGDKPRAWKSLQDAIKCNYDRWEVWDNLMVVSVDLGHFSEVRIYVNKPCNDVHNLLLKYFVRYRYFIEDTERNINII